MSDSLPPRTPPSWLARLVTAPILLAPIAFVWAGIRMVQTGSTVLGIGFVIVAAVTAVLALRRLRQSTSLLEIDPNTGDVSRAYLDYIVWAFIGLPFILIALLILTLITNDANRT